MAKKTKIAHTGPHKYQGIRRSRKRMYLIFRCMLADCPHYLARELVVGRESLCWRCGGVFYMTQALTSLKRPHCLRCTKGSEVKISAITENLDKLLEGI